MKRSASADTDSRRKAIMFQGKGVMLVSEDRRNDQRRRSERNYSDLFGTSSSRPTPLAAGRSEFHSTATACWMDATTETSARNLARRAGQPPKLNSGNYWNQSGAGRSVALGSCTEAWQRREASRWTRCQCLPEVQGLQLRTPCERSVLAGTCHHALAWQQGLKWLGDSGSHACAQAPRTQLAVISAPQIASGQTWLLASCGLPRVRGRSRTMMVAERLGQLQILGAAQSLTRLLILFVKQEGGRTPRWQGPPYVKSPPTRHANGR
ncbi:unnamed protein product [Effrenium voratum]|nr:unnamed protein product [Effrenium voratum]